MLFAQEQSKVKLTTHDFVEIVNEAAEISGARLVGVARFGSWPQDTNLVNVSAHIPKSWAGTEACLSVMSVDGFYQSQGTYSISSNWSGGTVALDYPTKQPKHVRDVYANSIAPLISQGACGEARLENSLVHWGGDLQDGVVILLNTSRSEETYLYFPENPEVTEIPCTVAKFENRTAFDTVCTINQDGTLPAELKIGTVSFRRGEMGREVEFKLNLSN